MSEFTKCSKEFLIYGKWFINMSSYHHHHHHHYSLDSFSIQNYSLYCLYYILEAEDITVRKKEKFLAPENSLSSGKDHVLNNK